MHPDDRYDHDPVARMRESRRPRAPRRIAARRGMWLEDATTGFYGRLTSADRSTVLLVDADDAPRRFPRDGVFLDDAGAVVLDFTAAAPTGRARSASGSFHAGTTRAAVARAGRIFVEGRHDAELVEQVWGHDLRVEGVVVELLDGADLLAAHLAEFAPDPGRRAGVLLDHLIAGTKESRIAAAAMAPYGATAVRIVGHPYIDVWQAVRPERLGIPAWPEIPRGTEWKRGICAALGWPHEDPADIGAAWSRIRGRVRDYRDLEPSFLGRVEELIDFVTVPGTR